MTTRPDRRPYDDDFQLIPDAIHRYEAVKEEVGFFLETYARDIAEQGHAEFAKAMCMDLVSALVEAYNDIDKQHLRAV